MEGGHSGCGPEDRGRSSLPQGLPTHQLVTDFVQAIREDHRR